MPGTGINVPGTGINSSDTTPVTITNRASYSYTITASGSPTAFEAAGLPQGLSVNRTSGLISGSPTRNGTFTVTLRALRTGVPTGTATKVFTVVSPPTPVINSDLSAINITLNANYSYQITASGSPTSYGASGLPSGLVINATTGIISGKPNKTGTSTVTLQALKTGGTTGTATKVFNVVQAPSFSYAATNSVNLNANVNIRPTSLAGYPAPTFSVISGSLPAGLSLNTSTAAITGKPTARGSNAIVVQGSNSVGSTNRATTIVVR